MTVASSIQLPAKPYAAAAAGDLPSAADATGAQAASQAGTEIGLSALPEKTIGQLAGQAGVRDAQQASQVASANRNGAPAIAQVLQNFSTDELALLLQGMKMKTDEGRLRTAKESLGITRQNLAVEHKKSMDKLQESIKKAESAAAKSKISKIFGWIAKVAAVIGSLVAVVALTAGSVLSGGGATPLLAMAVVGLVGSTMSLASAISQERGGPTLDLNTAMSWACKSVLEAASRVMAGAMGVVTGAVVLDTQLVGSLASGAVELGSPGDERASIIGASVSAVASIALAIVTCVATSGLGASEATKKALEKIPQSVNLVQAVLAGTSAANSAVNAGMNIDVAFDEHGAAQAQVDRKKFAAVIARLQVLMQQDGELITKLVNDIQESISQASQMIAAAGESHLQIAGNLGQPMA